MIATGCPFFESEFPNCLPLSSPFFISYHFFQNHFWYGRAVLFPSCFWEYISQNTLTALVITQAVFHHWGVVTSYCLPLGLLPVLLILIPHPACFHLFFFLQVFFPSFPSLLQAYLSIPVLCWMQKFPELLQWYMSVLPLFLSLTNVFLNQAPVLSFLKLSSTSN